MRPLYWLLLLMGAAGAWAWLTPRPLATGIGAAPNDTTGENSSFAATDAELIETGIDGAPLYRLRAQRIEQARPGAEVLLSSPQLAYQGQTRGAWALHAEHGVLSADRATVVFSGAVQADRTAPHVAPVHVRTEALTVNLRLRQADSRAPVALEWGRAQLTAGGLHADMVGGTFILDGEGHGQLRY